MSQDNSGIRDGVATLLERPRTAADSSGIWGVVVAEIHGPDGRLKSRVETHNLVTDVGDQFYGDRAAQAKGGAKTITAITNATTAVVTTSAAHGYGVGDVVTIAGVTPAGYNGSWAVTAVGSATTFSIYVGTALGAGSAFGTSTGLNYGPAAGMKLGTGSTAAAKSGAGAALVTYLSNSHQAFDATFPSTSGTSGGRVVTYKVTYAAGKATTASAITEVVIFLDFLADATSTAANTISRAILAGIGSKGALDTLTVTWTQTLLGA
jgi:hypothetical protein